MAKGIGDPQIVINNDVVGYKPNTVKFTMGFGERTSKTQSLGGGKTTVVHFENAETKLGKLSFDVHSKTGDYAGKTIQDFVQDIVDATDNNVISISDGEFSGIYTKMTLNNDPEITTGSDGSFMLEFTGMPMNK